MNDKKPKRTRHSATDARKCEEMARRYQWKLVDIEPRNIGGLEVDCVFEGDAQFPQGYMDLTQGENNEN